MKGIALTISLYNLIFLCSCSAIPDIYKEGAQMTLTQSAPIARAAAISPDGNYLLTGGLNGGFFYWDIANGVMVKRYDTELSKVFGTMQSAGIIPVAFASNGKHAVSGGNKITLWDLATGTALQKFANGDSVGCIGVSADGNKVLLSDQSDFTFVKDKIKLYDVETGQKLQEWKVDDLGSIVVLSPDGSRALSTGGGDTKSTYEGQGEIKLWNLSTGTIERTFQGMGENKSWMGGGAVLSMVFSSDGKFALSGGTDGSVRLWDLQSGAELRRIQAHKGAAGTKAVAFSPDGKCFLSVGGSDGLAKLWDRLSGAEIRSYRVSNEHYAAWKRLVGIINGWAAFTPDGKRFVVMGTDASFRIFDVATGKEVATLVAFSDGEWLVVTSDGYYNASKNGARKLNLTFDGKNYGVEQFYDVFYRPDIVAATLAGKDTKGLVSLTMNDVAMSPPPTVEVELPKDVKSAVVKVKYQIKDNGGGIGETRVFHNGKLIQSDGFYREALGKDHIHIAQNDGKAIHDSMRGIAVNGMISQDSRMTQQLKGQMDGWIEIEPVSGENEIGVSAFNGTNTVQGNMKTVAFQYENKVASGHLYVFSIGIDDYMEAKSNLKYAAKDAEDFAEKLIQNAKTLFNQANIHSKLLINDGATKVNINNQIEAFSETIKPQDTFVMFVAGHGVLWQNQYYILTHDYDGELNNPSTISSNNIVDFSKKIRALNQLLVFDTCHAGGVDNIVSGLYDARMSVLAKKMGLHIFASASDTQEAMEGYKGNGLFSYSLIDGLNNNKSADSRNEGRVTMAGLGDYAKQQTIRISKETGHEQTPLIINFGKDCPLYRLQ